MKKQELRIGDYISIISNGPDDNVCYKHLMGKIYRVYSCYFNKTYRRYELFIGRDQEKEARFSFHKPENIKVLYHINRTKEEEREDKERALELV